MKRPIRKLVTIFCQYGKRIPAQSTGCQAKALGEHSDELDAHRQRREQQECLHRHINLVDIRGDRLVHGQCLAPSSASGRAMEWDAAAGPYSLQA